MAFTFYLGYYEVTATETSSNGLVVGSTSGVASTTITWLTDNPLNVNTIGTMPTTIGELAYLIDQNIRSQIWQGGVFNSGMARWFAPQLYSGDATTPTANMSLYKRENSSSEFELCTNLAEDFVDGKEYGVLFTELKTPSFKKAIYYNAIDKTTPLKTVENFSFDCNDLDNHFTFDAVDGYYVARLDYAFDSSEQLDAQALPELPVYFNPQGDYSKNTHILDVFCERRPVQDQPNTTMLSLWNTRVFYLIGLMDSGQYNLGLSITCYENNKAPAQIKCKFYADLKTPTLLSESTTDIMYVTKDVTSNPELTFDSTKVEWSGIDAFIPESSTTTLNKTRSSVNYVANKITYFEYEGSYYVFPSQYNITKTYYVEGVIDSSLSSTAAVKLGEDKYITLFQQWIGHEIAYTDDDGTEHKEDIEVLRHEIRSNNNAIEDINQVITFDDVYNTNTTTIAGYYLRYITVKIKYYGNQIFKATSGEYIYHNKTTLEDNNLELEPSEFDLNTDDSVKCDTRDYSKKLDKALGLAVKSDGIYKIDGQTASGDDTYTLVNKSTTTKVYTRQVDCNLTLNQTGPSNNKQTIAIFENSNIYSWYSQDTQSTFGYFFEKGEGVLADATLKSFLGTHEQDLTLKLYGKFYPAKRSSSKVQLFFELYDQDSSWKMFDGTPGKVEEYFYSYYGRTTNYGEWAQEMFKKYNVTFGDTSDPIKAMAFSQVMWAPGGGTAHPVTTETISYLSSPYAKTTAVYIKTLDMTTITVPDHNFIIRSNNFTTLYNDYKWVPKTGTTEYQLPTDLVTSSISNLIQNGPLYLIAGGGVKIHNTYDDIQLTANGEFPVTLIDADFTNGEGFTEMKDGQLVEYKYGLNLDGIMGAACTYYGKGGDGNQIDTTLYSLINSSRTRKHTRDVSERDKCILAAVGAGGGGGSAQPDIAWQHAAGGGGGAGGFGVWFLDLRKIAKALGMTGANDYKNVKIKTSGGAGGATYVDRDKDGGNGTDLLITIYNPSNTTQTLQFTIPAGKGGTRHKGVGGSSGGAGGNEPTVNKEWAGSENEGAYIKITASKGAGGRRGESSTWYAKNEDELDYKMRDEVKPRTEYDTFLYNTNNFLGIYLDEAKYGKYFSINEIPAEDYPSVANHETYAKLKITSFGKVSRTNLLRQEQELKTKVYNDPYGYSLITLFNGGYYDQRNATSDKCSIGGTGAPSMCGFPTYWLNSDGKGSGRLPMSQLSASDITLYNSRPCYGCGGNGGSATYKDWGESKDDNASVGRGGGHAYWALFC